MWDERFKFVCFFTFSISGYPRRIGEIKRKKANCGYYSSPLRFGMSCALAPNPRVLEDFDCLFGMCFEDAFTLALQQTHPRANYIT